MPDGNYIPPNTPLYLTLDSIPVERFCRTIRIPGDPYWIGLVDGVLSNLMNAEAWREFGTLTPEEMADAWTEMMLDSWDEPLGCLTDDISPYWDDLDGDDTSGSPAVSTFSYEDLEDWAIEAFLVASGVPGAAVTYATIAPYFRLAVRKHSAGGIVKIFLDGVLYTQVDTYSAVESIYEFDVFVP